LGDQVDHAPGVFAGLELPWDSSAS
jgi:hypothetical protein